MHSNRSLRISCTPSFRITRWVNTQFTGNLLLRNDPAPSNIDIVAPHSRVSGAPRATLFRVLSLARSSQPIPETPLLFSQVHKVQKSKRESVKKEPVSCVESIPGSHHSLPLLFCWARCCWLRRSSVRLATCRRRHRAPPAHQLFRSRPTVARTARKPS